MIDIMPYLTHPNTPIYTAIALSGLALIISIVNSVDAKKRKEKQNRININMFKLIRKIAKEGL